MHVNVAALRQQTWRAEKVYDDFLKYAASIGCTRFQDEIIADDAQSKLLAKWWQSKMDGAW